MAGFEFESVIDKVIAEVHDALNAAVLETAEDIVEDVENAMVEPKSGVHYKGLPRTSSAPGEAPSVQSGDTQESYHAVPDGDLQAAAYSNSINAERMEYGTVFIEPRPALAPATERAGQQLEQKHGQIVGKAIEIVSL